jgi:DNA-3-methyladenine glycosylase I
MKLRCAWCTSAPLYQDYHDQEWGRPVHDDRKLFEALLLDTFQAGLSWFTILRKREHFRQAFAQFDPEKVAAFNDAQVEELMANNGIVRNRLKIKASITNARAFLAVQQEFGSFDAYIWQFTGGMSVVLHPRDLTEVRASSPESDAMSKDLRKRGFSFVGTTICYAFMQATGMMVEHTRTCFLYRG